MNNRLPTGKPGGAFYLRKSSMTELPARKSLYAVEFPTSPNPTNSPGEEKLHPSHSQHPLLQLDVPELFTCNGCKEHGAGKRFSCQQCDFQLHDFCALSPPALKSHPLHAQHQLTFYSKPKPGRILWPRCDVCMKATKGFAYRCSACHFQMHPCCALLSNEMKLSIHEHRLKLLPPLLGEHSGFTCGECKRQRSGRMYRCMECDYHLHAVCAKATVNGLEDNGIKITAKPNMLGPTARFASQIVIHFLGSLVEGVGQSVGQVLVQDLAKGRCMSRRRRRLHD
ncbi:Cysteine/Histidine-rich C1 domain family protein [Heracleum sosnowskyi]|uniref:Cysteine/Histidine-rich C1 domain family protein n=1 Tax=Heracleum sosnowskyi TaxID=360622 RepID=A0AAD8IXJ1_9APIA|nr:Cysteine/Histidine-rich C1 domain family protein [Heracleum sosnowskyi]